jgi:uncharacterized protein with ATP-grasp and redox domains
MRTYLECIPCFVRQTLQTGRVCGLNEQQIKKLLDDVGCSLKHIDLADSPPEMARKLQPVITAAVGKDDPFDEIKRKSNQAASAYYDEVKSRIQASDDKLKTALEVAIAGNIIDYGAVADLDIAHELQELMDREEQQIAHENHDLFAYDELVRALENGKKLLYIGDNAGEIVFDKACIETIGSLYEHLEITFVTRGTPILNDVVLSDALEVGMDKAARVISSGSDAPGLILERCSQEFLEEFEHADVIISKGQGNFEALSDVTGPIFFLFVAKCDVIARELSCSLRDIILKQQRT